MEELRKEDPSASPNIDLKKWFRFFLIYDYYNLKEENTFL